MKEIVRNGVLAGGNWIIDQVKMVDVYPGEERLANILYDHASNGGAPYNVLKALYKMGVSFPLEGIGRLGADERGREILLECQEMGMNTDQLKMMDGTKTSYTDVMTVSSSGKRTFFHSRGANGALDEHCFDFSTSQAKLFHLGYLLLLDKLDAIGPDGDTGASKVLKGAKMSGMVTSVDIVSEQSDRYKSIIPLSLPFVDILFINDFEAKMLTGIELYDETGKIAVENGYLAAEEIFKMGVLNWVIIHFPTGAIALNKAGQRIAQKGVHLPVEKIGGTVGAGDAFAAGVLAGIHDDLTMGECLELGVNVAAASLMDATSSGGVMPLEKCMQLGGEFGYREI